MALSWKARRRLSVLILVIGMPVWIIVAVSLVNLFDRPPAWLEIGIYVGLGVVWILPFRRVFRGIAQSEPEAEDPPHGPGA